MGDGEREGVGDGGGVCGASRAFICRLDIGVQAGMGSFHTL